MGCSGGEVTVRQESLNTKHVVSLDYALQRISAQLTKKLDSLEHTVAHRSVPRLLQGCSRAVPGV